jgi:hypothetical protein
LSDVISIKEKIMNRPSFSLLAATLLFAAVPEAALAGSTVFSAGNGVAIVSGTGIAIGDVVVGKGPAKTEERKTGAYTGLVIEAPVEMKYVVSASPSMKITAPANILPLITTEVQGRKLVIGLKKSVSMDGMIRVEASGSSLDSIAMTGSGDLKLSGESGKKLVVEVTGSGTIAATGEVEALSLDISGSGEVNAAGLRAQDLRIDVSGSGTIAAFAAKSAKVDLSGSGDVVIAGNPKQRSVERSGAGEVKFR